MSLKQPNKSANKKKPNYTSSGLSCFAFLQLCSTPYYFVSI